MPNSNQFGPLDPIFDNEKKRGAIDIGNSFPSEPDTGCSSQLFSAIVALNPITYFTLQGPSTDALIDWGSAGMTLSAGAGVTFENTIGGDFCSYARGNGGSTGRLTGSDLASLSPQDGGGLTVGILAQREASTASQAAIISKATAAGSINEWQIGTDDADATDITACLYSGGVNQFTRRRRSNTDAFPVSTWVMMIARYGTTTTSTPDLRINGVNIAGLTNETGTAIAGNAAPLEIFGRGGSSGTFLGSGAHPFTIAGQISDAQCQTIEDAARDEGWPI